MDPDFHKHVVIKKDLQGVPKHTFVMFYADWCTHCHSTSPLWKETAQEIKEKHPGVLISAIEAKDAETVNPEVKSFPTFCYYQSGKLQPDDNFKEIRSVENFKKWIDEKIKKHPVSKGGKSHKKRMNKKRRYTQKKHNNNKNKNKKWLNVW